MSAQTEADAADILESVVMQVRERVPPEQVALVQSFVRRFYAGVAEEDLLERTAGDLYGAAIAVWALGRQRPLASARVRAYNPEPQQHGWQSTHTVVELVTDDMPFLVDSVRIALSRAGSGIHLLIHPVMRVRRDAEGRLVEVLDPSDEAEGSALESVMQITVDRDTGNERLGEIEATVNGALIDVGLATRDWREMRGRLRAVIESLRTSPPPLPAEELESGQAFLEWLDADHFTFLGYRAYALETRDGQDVLCSEKGSSLGILRRTEDGGESAGFAALPPAIRALARDPELLIVTKANSRATVHRRSHMDHIGVKRFDAAGQVVGEHRFLGLFTSAAYNRTPRDIPLLREKLDAVARHAGYARGSHAFKALLNILETFPRDELFQVPAQELLDTALGILHLQERHRIRLFVHADRYARFCSCIVYVPRDRFNTQLREAFQDILVEAFGAEDLEFNVSLSESLLARLYFKLRLAAGAEPTVDVAAIEARMRAAARAWSDDLHGALTEHCGEERGNRLFRRYERAFRGGYRESYDARIAVHDIERMETLKDENALAMSLFRSVELADDELEFKLYRLANPIPLCDALPMLENMGLRVIDENPSKVKRAESPRVWIHDFGMRHDEPAEVDVDGIRDKFHEAFARVWYGDAENDGFNRLVLRAELSWREIVVLRACAKYLRQAGIAFSHEYMAETLARNAGVTASLVALFHARLDPQVEGDRSGRIEALRAAIVDSLDDVANLDEDRILRCFLDVVLAILRTNFYQLDAEGSIKPYVSFKLDPHALPELPEPRPKFEVFVYSPRVEGVHLRGGDVARGGLRWSDRREDFRTEVLGLMKAQMVKNAVIVPVGSKGGFVPKRLPEGDREAMLAEGKACYRVFIRGLLDVTDNLVDGEVVPPRAVVRHDGDDPYLVVAADKGTATFSDIANGIALEYGFWLGDAFASGGSNGYDHKGMGITARGAWESVKRHFRELGLNTQSTPFTVVGIGDMSGDVFGNGMLLSEHIKLVGAFNHLHIFLDPAPDPASSIAERRRMFELPRSTWDDYDRSLISTGGGVFARSAKSIELSPEVRAMLGVEAERMTPNELIRAMLRAPVDLLWNGGIGTYVKSQEEHDDDAGDRANDGVRIDATEIRARVVGEGGNLGFTQRGRIEAALAGVRINTDAIDNAGGVDCSDHEVNIKVLLNAIVAAGDLTDKQRNAVLAGMTDEVADLVLRNNYLQTQALSLANAQAPSLLDVHARLMRALELAGELAREIEYLPSKEVVDERQAAGRGLTAPELSVLMAYVKIRLFRQLVESGFALDEALRRELVEYFPTAVREPYAEQMPAHRLAAEIVCTQAANELVNRCGITFVYRLGEETGAEPADIARAYLVARDSFRIEDVWAEIEALDGTASAQAQTAMLLEARKLIERASRWVLRNRARPIDITTGVAFFADTVAAFAGEIRDCVSSSAAERIDALAAELVAGAVPAPLARRVATFAELYAALDVTEVVTACGLPVADISRVYFGVTARLGLEWLRDQIVALPRSNRWQTLSRAALRDELYEQARSITADVLRGADGAGVDDGLLEAWIGANAQSVERASQVMADLHAAGPADFTMLSVAMREVRGMRQGAQEGRAAAG